MNTIYKYGLSAYTMEEVWKPSGEVYEIMEEIIWKHFPGTENLIPIQVDDFVSFTGFDLIELNEEYTEEQVEVLKEKMEHDNEWYKKLGLEHQIVHFHIDGTCEDGSWEHLDFFGEEDCWGSLLCNLQVNYISKQATEIAQLKYQIEELKQ
jgi:hypothetical protein